MTRHLNIEEDVLDPDKKKEFHTLVKVIGIC